jgi:hypothetical protein
MKKIYEKPVLSKRGTLAGVTAVTTIGSGSTGT